QRGRGTTWSSAALRPWPAPQSPNSCRRRACPAHATERSEGCHADTPGGTPGRSPEQDDSREATAPGPVGARAPVGEEAFVGEGARLEVPDALDARGAQPVEHPAGQV